MRMLGGGGGESLIMPLAKHCIKNVIVDENELSFSFN